jgi:hypothetical protein
MAIQLPAGTHEPGESLYTLSVDEAHVNSDVDTNNNTTSFAVILWMDSDGDGMPDHWEIANGLNRFDASDASADPDHDGLTNLQEYKQGKQPLVFDNLRFIASQYMPNGQFQFLANVEVGRNYELQASTNLTNWKTIVTFTATNSPMVFLDPNATNFLQRYYRLNASSSQPPVITQQPVSRTNLVGTTATFSATVIGAAPNYYQWRKGGLPLAYGGNISGVTNLTLTLTNVQMADAGDFDLVVSNSYGAATSQVATLVVPNFVPPGLLLYLPFDGNANDASGNGRHGVIQGAVLTTNRFGRPDAAYLFNGANHIQVGDLDPDAYTNGFSFGAWIRPDAFSGVMGWTYDAGWGSTYLQAGGSSIGFRVGTGNPSTDHSVNGVSVPLREWTHVFIAHNPTNDSLYVNGQLINRWISYPMQGNVATLLIGASYVGNFNGAIDEVAVYGRELTASEVGSVYSATSLVPPQIPAITLQPQARTNLVGTLAAFTVSVTGTAPLLYQWRKDGANLSNSGNISGVTSTNLILANVQLSDSGGYSLVVTNNYGSVTSLAAALTVTLPPTNRITLATRTNGGFILQFSGTPNGVWWVLRSSGLVGPWTSIGTITLTANGTGSFTDTNPPTSQAFYRLISAQPQPPVIIQQPVSRTNLLGTVATFALGAGGDSPLTYQWRKNGTNLLGATSSNLSLTNVQFANAGSYDAILANSFGSVTSQLATLTVVTQVALIRITNVTATASSELSSYGRLASYMASGGYFWETSGIGFPGPEPDDRAPLAMFDLGGFYTVGRIRINNFPESQVAIKRLLLESSQDGVNYSVVTEITNINQSVETVVDLFVSSTRYIRFRILENWGGTIYPVAEGAPATGFYGFAGLGEVAFYGQ